eukprot:1828123-Amphidinium_carterae.1
MGRQAERYPLSYVVNVSREDCHHFFHQPPPTFPLAADHAFVLLDYSVACHIVDDEKKRKI